MGLACLVWGSGSIDRLAHIRAVGLSVSYFDIGIRRRVHKLVSQIAGFKANLEVQIMRVYTIIPVPDRLNATLDYWGCLADSDCPMPLVYSDLVCENDETAHSAGGHSHGSSSPLTQCFLSNTAFLRTMALCLNEHCSKDDVPLSTLKEYWEGHLATGTLSDTSLEPAMSYHSALADAQKEAQDRELTFLIKGQELNQTMLIREENFQAMLNYQRGFELGEIDHGRNRCVPHWLLKLPTHNL